MSGRWLIALASRLLRNDTFRLMVAPAMADLQHERTARSLAGRTRDHAVIWLTLVRALAHDLPHRAAGVAVSDSARAMWPRLLAAYALIFIVGTLSRLNQGLRIHTPDMPPGEFNKLPLPTFGDGLEPYLAGLLVSMALTAAAYTMVPAVFMLRRRRVHAGALVVGVLALASITYGAARMTRPTRQHSSDYASAAIMRSTGLYPRDESLAAIVRVDVQPRRDEQARRSVAAAARGDRDIAAEILAHTHWIEISRGLSVLVYALIGAAIARGVGFSVLIRLAAIIGATFAIGPVLPYLSLLLWPLDQQSLGPTERVMRENQLVFLVLPLVAALFLLLPSLKRPAAGPPISLKG